MIDAPDALPVYDQGLLRKFEPKYCKFPDSPRAKCDLLKEDVAKLRAEVAELKNQVSQLVDEILRLDY